MRKTLLFFLIQASLLNGLLFAQSPNYGSQFHQYADMKGTDDYINIGNMGAVPLQGTISMWLKYDGLPSNFSNAFTTNLGGGNANVFRVEAGSGLVLVSGDPFNAFDIHTFLGNLVRGQWYKIDFVYDMAVNNAKGYVNGVLVFDEANTHWPTTFPDVKIGVGYNLTRKWFGKVDEVSFWNIARSTADIQQGLNTELSGSEAGLVAYYNMNQTGQGQNLVVPNNSTSPASGGAGINGLTVGTAVTPGFSSAAPGCSTNLLVNSGFESPVVPNTGDNILNAYSFGGWTMTGGQGFNIVKANGFYAAGPDYGENGIQYAEVAFGDGTAYQDFTVGSNGTNVAFGGFYSSRSGGGWTTNIQLYAMPGNTLVASSTSLTYLNQGTEIWMEATGNATLNAGTYRYVANIPDDANFDSAYVNQSCLFTLPLKLLSFSGVKKDHSIFLQWKTTNETNAGHFNIQRSGDGRVFANIGQTAAYNNTLENIYHFTDNNSLQEVNYYRLQMVDKDGKFTYSNIIRFDSKHENQLRLYPNPAHDYVIISGATPGGSIKIINTNGEVVKELTVNSNSFSFPVSGLTRGIYVCQYQHNNSTNSLKLIIE